MALIDDLITYYKFDADADDSHSSNDGTVNGATLTTGDGGLIDEAYDFDGTNDNIDSNYDFGTVYTLSLWAYFETWDKFRAVCGIQDETGSAGTREFNLAHTASNTVKVQYYNSSNGVAGDVSGTIAENAWNHIVLTRSGNNIELWVDNSSQGTDSTATKNNPARSMVFGWNGHNNNNQFFNGLIDEVGIWDVVISDAQVGELYNSGAGLAYPFEADGLIMLTPNGAEQIDTLSSYEITWSDTGIIANVKLELSTDNGGSYSTIVASTANDNSFDWDVPNVKSDFALIRISDVLDDSVNDVSDAVFRIIEPQDADRPKTSKGTKEIATRYPVTSGLTAETTSQVGRQSNLVPERGSIVPRRKKVGF